MDFLKYPNLILNVCVCVKYTFIFIDTSTRNWDFSIKEYEVLMERLKHLKPHVVVGKIPSYVLNCVRMPKPDYSCIDLTKIETELLSALMPFQVEGVWLVFQM